MNAFRVATRKVGSFAQCRTAKAAATKAAPKAAPKAAKAAPKAAATKETPKTEVTKVAEKAKTPVKAKVPATSPYTLFVQKRSQGVRIQFKALAAEWKVC